VAARVAQILKAASHSHSSVTSHRTARGLHPSHLPSVPAGALLATLVAIEAVPRERRVDVISLRVVVASIDGDLDRHCRSRTRHVYSTRVDRCAALDSTAATAARAPSPAVGHASKGDSGAKAASDAVLAAAEVDKHRLVC